MRYEAGGTPCHETLCHCSACRRASGAPCVAWFTVPRAAWRLTSGRTASFRSSTHATRSFCPRCGTPVTFASDRFPDEIDVTTGSLDDPEALPPRDHTHAAAKLCWIEPADGLPRFPGAR